MSKFSLLVTSSPIDSQSSYSAYRFALAAVQNQHQVLGVFFYQSGVLNANGFQVMLSDDASMLSTWKEFSKEYSIPLKVCVTAANRRGVITSEDAKDADLEHFNLYSPFESVGLGELIELTTQCDRLVQF